jgi:hypothetical protein
MAQRTRRLILVVLLASLALPALAGAGHHGWWGPGHGGHAEAAGVGGNLGEGGVAHPEGCAICAFLQVSLGLVLAWSVFWAEGWIWGTGPGLWRSWRRVERGVWRVRGPPLRLI